MATANAASRIVRRRSAQPPTAERPYLSQLLGRAVADAEGARVARLRDLVVRFDSGPHPPVSGIVAQQGRRDFFVPWGQVEAAGPEGVRLRDFTVDLRPFKRRPGEALRRNSLQLPPEISAQGKGGKHPGATNKPQTGTRSWRLFGSKQVACGGSFGCFAVGGRRLSDGARGRYGGQVGVNDVDVLRKVR